MDFTQLVTSISYTAGTYTILGTGALSIAVGLFYLSPRSVKRAIIKKPILAAFQTIPQVGEDFGKAVLRHSELITLAENLWVVRGTNPPNGPQIDRNMFVFRAPNSRKLVIHTAVCVREEVLDEILKLGEIDTVIVPNKFHRLDLKPFYNRFPDVKVVCPKAIVPSVEVFAKVHGVCEDLYPRFPINTPVSLAENPSGVYYDIPADGQLDCFSGEALFVFQTSDASSALVCADFFFNVEPSQIDFVGRLMGFGTGFGLSKLSEIIPDDVTKIREYISRVLIGNTNNWNLDIIAVGHGPEIVGATEVARMLYFARDKLPK